MDLGRLPTDLPEVGALFPPFPCTQPQCRLSRLMPASEGHRRPGKPVVLPGKALFPGKGSGCPWGSGEAYM